MNTLPELEYTRPTQSEESKLDSGRVFVERRIRERNKHDDRMEKLREARRLTEGLYGPAP